MNKGRAVLCERTIFLDQIHISTVCMRLQLEFTKLNFNALMPLYQSLSRSYDVEDSDVLVYIISVKVNGHFYINIVN